ncbi:MAG: hypothetical protein AAF492_30110 [Verrucomicrobiota bacterium]
MASYIDLNPIRAGIAEDPKEYRWSGYGAAIGGDKQAQRGLKEVMISALPTPDWQRTAEKYRVFLFGVGEERSERKGFDREKVQEVLDAGGELNSFEWLRCRVRYFSDGVALGGRAFLEEIFQAHRDRFGAKRTSGSRNMKFGERSGLFTMRDLRKGPVTAPG